MNFKDTPDDRFNTRPTRNLWLAWTDDVDREVILHLRDRLPDILDLRVAGDKRIEPDYTTYREDLGQFDSLSLLERLRRRRPARSLLLAITNMDLFVEGLNFVFGSADPQGGCAVISLARLGIGFPGPALTRELLLKRALIEAVHELGHLFGLGHCRKIRCVMNASDCLIHADRKQPDFCPRCREMLRHE
jgi:archaemetzincin